MVGNRRSGTGPAARNVGVGLVVALLMLSSAVGQPPPGERRVVRVRSHCRDRYFLPADRPGVLPGESWTELDLVLELRPLDGVPSAWEVRAVEAGSVVHEGEGEASSRWTLPPACRGIVLGRATWRGGEHPWKLDGGAKLPAECAPLSRGWAAAVLDQAARSPEKGSGSGTRKRRVDRWRQFGGDWTALEIEGRDVPCGGDEAGGARCWEGKARVLFPAGREGSGGRTVGEGPCRVRCLPLPTRHTVPARFCRRKVSATSARILVPSSGRVTDWSNRCEVTVETAGQGEP